VTVAGCATLTWLQNTIAFNHQFLVAVRKFSLTDAGAIAEVWGFAGAAGQVVLSLASDRVGRKPVVVLAALVALAASAVYLAGGYGMRTMQLLLGLIGFCGHGLLPIVLATCVSELVPAEQRGTALGITNLFAVIIGTTIMPLIGGMVADISGLTGALWIGAISLAIVAGAIALIRDTAPRVVARKNALAAQSS
jgi:MFS family permease